MNKIAQKKNTVLAFFYRGCNQVKFFLVINVSKFKHYFCNTQNFCLLIVFFFKLMIYITLKHLDYCGFMLTNSFGLSW